MTPFGILKFLNRGFRPNSENRDLDFEIFEISRIKWPEINFQNFEIFREFREIWAFLRIWTGTEIFRNRRERTILRTSAFFEISRFWRSRKIQIYFLKIQSYREIFVKSKQATSSKIEILGISWDHISRAFMGVEA